MLLGYFSTILCIFYKNKISSKTVKLSTGLYLSVYIFKITYIVLQNSIFKNITKLCLKFLSYPHGFRGKIDHFYFKMVWSWPKYVNFSKKVQKFSIITILQKNFRPFFCRFEEILYFSLTSLENKIFIKKSNFDKFQNSILKICLLPL